MTQPVTFECWVNATTLSGNVALPWFKPALLLGLVIAWGQALVWLFPRMQRMQTLCAAAALLPLFALLAYWAKYFLEETLSSLLREVPLALLLTGMGTAYAVAWVAVTLERRSISVNRLIMDD